MEQEAGESVTIDQLKAQLVELKRTATGELGMLRRRWVFAQIEMVEDRIKKLENPPRHHVTKGNPIRTR